MIKISLKRLEDIIYPLFQKPFLKKKQKKSSSLGKGWNRVIEKISEAYNYGNYLPKSISIYLPVLTYFYIVRKSI